MVLRYSFKIEGTEIGAADGAGPNYVLADSKINLTRENSNGNFAKIIVAGSITTTITPTTGNEVIISRGEISASDTIVFKGNIKKIDQNDDNTWTLTCADPLQKLKYDLFTISYDRNIDPEAGELSAIASDILTNGGFTPSVVASGTGAGDITVDKFLSNDQSRLNRLNLIQKLLNWLLYYDYNADTVRLEPKGYVQYPITLNVGTEIDNIPNWEEDIENMRNKITVNGATQLDTRVDTFTGDANETEFTLTYAPVSIETKISGTLQVLGIDGAQTGFDYEVDVDRKLLTFVTAPPAASNNIVCTYTTFLPTPVTGDSPASISQYGLTQADKFTFEDVVTVADAEVRVEQLLNILEFGEISTVLNTTEYNIKVGNEVTIADPLQPLKDGNYIVESKVITYGANYDVVKVGTPRIDISDIINTIDERLRNLEGKDTTLGGILRQLIVLVRTAVTLTKESLKLEKRNMTNSWTPGHDTLAYLRASQIYEADCSDNGNDGTWAGTDVATGTQYATSSEAGGVITTPLQRLGCGVFNGTDHKITSTVSEASIVAVSFFIDPDTASRDIMQLDTGKVISLDGSSNVTTSGFTNATVTETAMTTGTHVYVEFDAITLTNPTVGYSTTYYDGNLDELMIFNTTLSATDITDIQENKFSKLHSKFANCKLWYSFDDPLIGDRRTNYITVFDTTY
jgi:hypothetical protein